MKPVLIIKTGYTVQSLAPHKGDFEDWIIEDMGVGPSLEFKTVTVCDGEKLPDASEFSGIVITGSPAMVTDKEVWSENTASYLRDLVNGEVPVLGICYGHQLLAHALGGEVSFHPEGREIGTVAISVSLAGESDPLFSSLSQTFNAQVSHSQTVTVLPKGAVVLASNRFEKHQAVRYQKNIWGLQFHPEFDAEVMKGYVMERQEALKSEGFKPEQLLANITDTEEAIAVLRSFAELLIK